MRKIIKNINMQQWRFNDSWRRLPGYLQGNKINWQKGALVKTEEQKIHKLTNAQIDALLTKIMDNGASRAYIENIMPEPRMGIYHNRRLFENALLK